jgi:hypothetical protein
MNAKQDNKVGMFTSVKLACAEDAAIWAGVPAFGAAFAKFSECVDRIEEFAQKQAERSNGATADKKRCRESMCDAAQVIAGAVRAYAIDNDDLELAGKVDFSRSTLLGGRDRTSSEKSQTIHRLASDKVAELSDHGVTAAKLKSLQTKIDAYVACLQRPRQIIAASKTATAQLESEIETADLLLTDSLDGLVLQFKDSEPAFYNNYTNARAVVNNASGRNSGEDPAQPKAA